MYEGTIPWNLLHPADKLVRYECYLGRSYSPVILAIVLDSTEGEELHAGKPG